MTLPSWPSIRSFTWQGLETSSWSSSRALDRPTPQRHWICSCQPLETGHPTGPWWSDATGRAGYAWRRRRRRTWSWAASISAISKLTAVHFTALTDAACIPDCNSAIPSPGDHDSSGIRFRLLRTSHVTGRNRFLVGADGLDSMTYSQCAPLVYRYRRCH